MTLSWVPLFCFSNSYIYSLFKCTSLSSKSLIYLVCSYIFILVIAISFSTSSFLCVNPSNFLIVETSSYCNSFTFFKFLYLTRSSWVYLVKDNFHKRKADCRKARSWYLSTAFTKFDRVLSNLAKTNLLLFWYLLSSIF